MEINEIITESVLIVELNGRLDALVSDKTNTYFADIVAANDIDILIDFKNLSYINSTGLRILIITFKSLKKKGKTLAICNMQKKIKEVFQHSGFDNYFDVNLTKEMAMAKFEDDM